MPQITDLSKIPAPEVVKQVSFEDILSRRKQRFIEQYETKEQREHWAEVLKLESEPVVKLLEECAYSEMLWRQELNEAAQGLMLAYARGGDLDQIAAMFDIKRFVIQEARTDIYPPVEQVLETDDALRARVQRAFETLSTAGPTAAYESIAAGAHAHVKDVRAVSPSPAVVDIAVLSNQGDGAAAAEVVAAVAAAVNDRYRRPVADRVTVKSAEIVRYRIAASLKLFKTPDYEPVLAEARRKMAAAAVENQLIGRDVDLSMIYAALRVEGVQGVVISEPTQNIVIGDAQAAFCTEIEITYGGENE